MCWASLQWLMQGGDSANIAVNADDWRMEKLKHVRQECNRLAREEPLCFKGDKRGRAESLLCQLVGLEGPKACKEGDEKMRIKAGRKPGEGSETKTEAGSEPDGSETAGSRIGN